MADHIAVGRATLDAVRDAANRWVFPNCESGAVARRPRGMGRGSPLAGTLPTRPRPSTWVRLAGAHAAYLSGLGGPMSEPAEFLASLGRATGTRLRTRYAAAFEVMS